MTDPNTTTETTDQAAQTDAEPSYDELIAQAAEAMAEADPSDSDEGDADATEPSSGSAEQGESEPAEGDAGAQDDAEQAAEGEQKQDDAEPEEKPGEVAWRHAQVRRKERQLERRLAEVDRQLEELKTTKADLTPPDPRTKPAEFFEWAARRAGMSGQQLYELQTRKQLGEQADPIQEVAALRAELQQLKAEQSERRKQAEQRSQAQAVQEGIQHDTKAVLDHIKAASDRYESASVDHPDDVEAYTRALVEIGYRDGTIQDFTAADLASMVEEYSAKRVQHFRGRLAPPPDEDRVTSQARDGQGPPGAISAPKPAGTSAPRSTVTNNDAAASSGAHRELTDDERYRRAGDILNGGSL